ncbi:mucin-2 [Vicugna pacos]|uniref:Mucin-2 n=1 Tax=Vicugna pacos TaxID=30538 RepID=A0ABM5E114_VICPA
MTKAQPLQGTSTVALRFGRAPPEGPWRPGLLTPPPAAPPEGRTRNHGHSVCSTWGDSHYKTFDGDVFRFPGLCDYNFASDCRDAYKEFAVHLKRGPGRSGGHPQIEYILLTVKDDTIYLTPQLAVVNGAMVSTPHYSSGLLIEKSDAYTKVSSRTGLALMWDREDSLMLELDSKFQNHTCGLCGDYNGLQTYSEFLSDGVLFSPIEFGNLQKINKPEVVCEDPEEVPVSESCSEHRAECESLLMGTAFEDCRGLVPLQPYVQACMQDRCQCAQGGSCVCSTVAEFSRQCSHAGGRPGNWRTATLCAKSCPGNMVYLESGSPCVDTCSHLEVSSLCEEHRMDGCFCPEGTVYDDIAGSGCIPVSQCHCKLHGRLYKPGEQITSHCEQCECDAGRWVCADLQCPGTCALEGGAHISTFDGRKYTFHGDCYYVLTKDAHNDSYAVLGELTSCGSSDKQTCLKTVVLLADSKKNVVAFKSDGSVLLNELQVNLPHVTASFSIFQPSSHHLLVSTAFGLRLQVQLLPVMQLFLTLEPAAQGHVQGLCGNFNGLEGDDFQTAGGLVEATGAGFANTWKAQSSCQDKVDWLDDPCSLSIESANYAEHWCSLLKKTEAPFGRCHSAVDPAEYYKRCKYDTCNCRSSEDCMCAALSSYAHACAAKGVLLWGWREGVCNRDVGSCPTSQLFRYNLTTCQRTCRSLSEPDTRCLEGFPPVDGCGCPDQAFLDEKGRCVPLAKCSCYHHGLYLEAGEVVLRQEERCVCQNGRLHCKQVRLIDQNCTAPKIHVDCNNLSALAIRNPRAASCQTLAAGSVRAGERRERGGRGGCVVEAQCPCVHNSDVYPPGDKIRVDCNTCTCQKGRWACTQSVCHGTCAVYGNGHYITFDGKYYDFDGHCSYVAVQDYCGQNSSLGSFSIVTENVPCGTTGVTCSKAIKIFLGRTELKLEDRHCTVIPLDVGQHVAYTTREVGQYLVVEASTGVIVIWDKRTTIFIKLAPSYKGSVCGLCGNFDQRSSNDFTTRDRMVVESELDFGNSWKEASTCPDVSSTPEPCTLNWHRRSWAEKQCSIIKSRVFRTCHSKVDPKPFYEACVHDSCSCDTGGDCECFCSAVASYAQECAKEGACVTWRTPELCPVFCDYYNPPDECEWHYEPCGKRSFETCRSLSGIRSNISVSYLEGCYPRCPKKRPVYDEDLKKCVRGDECGCYVEDTRYPPGVSVPTEKPCQSCKCTKSSKVVCRLEEGRILNYTEIGPLCYWELCGPNGTVEKHLNICTSTTPPSSPSPPTSTPVTTSTTTTITPVTTTSTTPSTATTTTPSTTSSPGKTPITVPCCWSDWINGHHPSGGSDDGDWETFDHVCTAPLDIECRSATEPHLSWRELGQETQCNVSFGFICKNEDQFGKGPFAVCYDYEIRVYCCEKMDCTTSTGTPTPTPTTTSTVTPTPTEPPTATSTTTETSTPSTTTTTSTPSTSCVPTTTPSTTTTTETTTPSTTTTTETTTPSTTTTTETTTPSTTTTTETTTPAPSISTTSTGTPTPTPTTTSTVTPTPTEPPTATSTTTETSTPSTTTTTSTTAPTTTATETPAPASSTTETTTPSTTTTTETTTPSTTTTTETTTPSTTTTTETTTPAPSISTTSTGTPTPTPTTTSTVTPTPTEPPTATSTTTETSTPSTTTTTSTPSTSCVPVCNWTGWLDSAKPNFTKEGGDIEAIENVCRMGSVASISCRAAMFPSVPLQELGQTVVCDTSVGLVCKNQDQKPGVATPMPYCLNYEINVYCCVPRPGCPTTYPTTISQSSTTTPTTTATETPAPASSTTETTTPSTTTTTETTTPSTTTTTETTTPSTTTTTETTTPAPSISTTSTGTPTPTPTTTSTVTPTPTEPPTATSTTTETSTPSTTTTTSTPSTSCSSTTAPTTTATETPAPASSTTETTTPSTTTTTETTTPSTTTTTETTTHSTTTTTETTTPAPSISTTSTGTPTPTPTTTSTVTPTPTEPPTATSTTTETSTPSTTTTTSTPSTSCVPVCNWTGWLDSAKPNFTKEGGDIEAIENVCRMGSVASISCRAAMFPSVPLQELGQTVVCDTSVGLVCKNQDQKPGVATPMPYCLNYEINVYCCVPRPGCPTTYPTTISQSSTTTPTTTATETPAPASSTTETTTPSTTTTTETTTPSTTTTTETTTPSTTTTTETTTPAPSISTTSTGTPTPTPTTTSTVTPTPTEPPTATSTTTETSTPTSSTTETTTPSTTTTTETTTPSTTTTTETTTHSTTTTTETTTPAPSISTTSTGTPTPTPTTTSTVTPTPTEPPTATSTTTETSTPSTTTTTSTTTPTTTATETPAPASSTTETTTPSTTTTTETTTPSTTTTTETTTRTPSISTTSTGTPTPTPTTTSTVTPTPTEPPTATSTTTETSTPTSSTTEATTPSTTTTTETTTPSTTTTTEITTPAPSISTTSTGTPTPTPTTTSTVTPTPTEPPTATSTTIETSTPSTTTTTSTPSTSCVPVCNWTGWLDSAKPNFTKEGGDIEAIENVCRMGSVASISCRAAMFPSVPLQELGQTVVCDTSVGLVCKNQDQKPGVATPVPYCLNYEINVYCCVPRPGCPTTYPTTISQSMTPTPTLTTSTEPPTSTSTTTETSTLSTTTPTETLITSPLSTSITGPSTPPIEKCCELNGEFYSPGEVTYNVTEGGMCRYAYCSKSCELEFYNWSCPSTPSTTLSPLPTTTAPSSTASSVSTTTHPPGCLDFNPPRKENETWWLCNCTMAVCKHDNTVELVEVECNPPPMPTCSNGLTPVRVKDPDGCCWHWECDCYCTGWGDPHYVTFDGLYYSHQGACTYVLVEEAVPTVDGFGVYVDNYHCDPRDRVSCPRTLIVRHETQEVRLETVQMAPMTVQVQVNRQAVALPYKKYGLQVYESGINLVVAIPELGALVSYNGLAFSIRLPYRLFGNNTKGQCGTCTNTTVDDCVLPSGEVVDNCEVAADQWAVYDPSKPQCPHTSFTTQRPATSPSAGRTTVGEACASPLCELIKDSLFAQCHALAPPQHYYDACVFDSCLVPDSGLECASLQTYAALCAQEGICVDWRNHTRGACQVKCPAHREYRACGPAEEPTCQSSPSQENSTQLVEGCFCPEGTVNFGPGFDVCVDSCGCVGPDNVPREFGEHFQFDCKDCICLEGGSGISCQPRACSQDSRPECGEDGTYLVTEVDPADPCCSITSCKCNASLCREKPLLCPLGFEVKSEMVPGRCCPLHSCVPKGVCVVENAEYQPGSPVYSSKCQNCVCTTSRDSATQLNTISCSHVPCNTSCNPGFELVDVPGECCKKCQQTHCIIQQPSDQHLVLKPGDMKNDPLDNCTLFSCVKLHNQLISSVSKITCPDFDPSTCLPGSISLMSNGCCRKCIPHETGIPCSMVSVIREISHNGCTKLVSMNDCSGSCGTFAMYSAQAQALDHRCSCCKEQRTSQRQVALQCPGGGTLSHTYTHIESCGCQNTTCELLSPQDRARRSIPRLLAPGRR